MDKEKLKPRLAKRAKVRIISFISYAFAIILAFGISENIKRKKYERLISTSQQRALTELGTYLDSIDVSLTKGKYAASPPMVASLASSLWKDATGAKTSLSQLDANETPLSNTYKFLSQVGEFTMALNRKVADGKQISGEEKSQLEKLQKYAKDLSRQINEMEKMLENDNLNFEKISSTLIKEKDDEAQAINFSDTMDEAEQAIQDYPVLLYDGPFADNIDQKESQLLKEHSRITKEKAKKKAAIYASVEEEALQDLSNEDGKMPAFVFGGKDFTIAITKNGGFLSYMLGNSFAGEEKIDEKEAIQKAKDYLKTHGYKNMKESYYTNSDGVCTINFAYTKDEIIYYPDLIKVSVDLGSEKVISVDARGYIMNHHEREIHMPSLTLRSGGGKLASGLEVIKSQLCVIPKDNGDERFAYEYHCKDETGQEVLVYIDPYTGDEAEILLLMYEDNGILTK